MCNCDLCCPPSKYEALQAELDSLKVKYAKIDIRLKRTVNASRCALLEMSAWMGIPEDKRIPHIRYLMENIIFCAENDLRRQDEDQKVQAEK